MNRRLVHPNLFAIAAMASNRVIGSRNTIPWHLPDDFKWFKQTTLGHILLMGRKTFQSIGKALPGRETWVLSRAGFSFPGVRTLSCIEDLPLSDPRTVFVCGGADLYQQLLPSCSELLLTRVQRSVEGDAFFPPFEDQFEQAQVIRETPEFKIVRYKNKNSNTFSSPESHPRPA